MSTAALHAPARVLTYRDRVLRLHDDTSALITTLELPGASTELSHYDQSIFVAEIGRCLVQVGQQGWLVDIDGDALALTAVLTFPHNRTFRATLDQSGERVISEGRHVDVWTRHGRFQLKTLRTPTSVAVLNDGAIVVGTLGGFGEIWERWGTKRRTFREKGEGTDLYIRALDAPRARFVATASNTSAIEVHDETTSEIAMLEGHTDDVWSAAFSPMGRRLASGAADRTVRIWEPPDARERLVLHGHGGTVHHVEFHPSDDGLLLSADDEGSVRLWRLEGPSAPALESEGGVGWLERTPAGTLAGARSGALLWPPRGEPVSLAGLLVNWTPAPDGERAFALTSEGYTVRLWELGSDAPRRVCDAPGPNGTLSTSAIAPDGHHFVLADDDVATLWSASGERMLDERDYPDADVRPWDDAVTAVGFGVGGSRVAVAFRSGTACLWDTDGTSRGSFRAGTGSRDSPLLIAFDPLGELILTGIRIEAGLWDWEGEHRGSLPVAGHKVNRLAFSPDGSRILTISSDRDTYMELWTRDGERVANVVLPGAAVPGQSLHLPQSRLGCVVRRSQSLHLRGGRPHTHDRRSQWTETRQHRQRDRHTAERDRHLTARRCGLRLHGRQSTHLEL